MNNQQISQTQLHYNYLLQKWLTASFRQIQSLIIKFQLI